MVKKITPLLALLVLVAVTYSFTTAPARTAELSKNVKWYTWEEAIAANEANPKKIMVDVTTDWCGWCKRMEANTFENPEISKYLNENFYPIKLNAEMKEDIVYDGNTFKYIPDAGRRGIHTLAYSLLDGQMSYPSIVFLDESVQRVMVSKGYKGPDDFMVELKYTAQEAYKSEQLDAFREKQ
ncbi:MAG: DUF255 domain-containing protein [Bacteroidota bacterium]